MWLAYHQTREYPLRIRHIGGKMGNFGIYAFDDINYRLGNT